MRARHNAEYSWRGGGGRKRRNKRCNTSPLSSKSLGSRTEMAESDWSALMTSPLTRAHLVFGFSSDGDDRKYHCLPQDSQEMTMVMLILGRFKADFILVLRDCSWPV